MINFSSLQGLPARLAHPLAALALLAATAGAARAQTFAPAVTYATGVIPQDIVAADVNGDGRLDLLMTNSNSNSVGVLLGAATPGTFPATATLYSSGGSFPVGLGVGDVDGDGRPDLVVDNQNSNSVSVLLNSATTPGTFGAPTTYASGTTSPRGLGLTDLNGDGRLDIVMGGNATLGVLLSSATTPGTFGAAATYPTGGQADGIAVGDVNGDGRPDVAVTGYLTTNTITILLNAAAAPGTFPTATAYNSGGVVPRGVTLADVNSDGRADIVVGNESSNTVGVLPNLAAAPGTFGTAATYPSGASGPDGVRVRDMNGDGRPDIVATNYNVSNGTTVSVLLNSATTLGTFAAGTTYSSGGQGPVGLALGDLNSDGRPDIAATNVLSNTVGVLLNTTVFAAPTLTSLSPPSGPVGTSVTLTGTNLGTATGVSFNGTAATAFAVVNATTVTATVPTGASSGPVTVSAGGGTSNGLAFVVGTPANNALAFDGTDDYVALGNPASLQFGTGDFTTEVWLRNDQPSSVGYTLALGTLNLSGTNLWLGAKNGFAALGLSSTDFETNVSIADGRWHHVAAARTAGTLVIYVDGVAALTQPSAQNLNTGNPFLLGNYSTDAFATNFYWRGRLDEVRLYNAGLTQAQVQADMFSTASARPANQVAYYNFDQGIAGGNNAGITALPDLSGTGNNGALTNFALSGNASNWVRSFPTITGIAPASGPVGTSVSITGTNLTDATGFAFNSTSTAGFTTPANDLMATVTVPTGATTGPVSVSSATLTRYNGPVFTVNVTAVTWTGAVSTDWFTAGNWSPAAVPGATTDATITGAPSGGRFPALSSGAASARNLTLNNGATLNLSGTSTLALAANLTNNGTLAATGGTVDLGSTTLSNILGSGNTRFWNLTVGASGAQQSTSASTAVQRLMTLNGNFATNGNSFTLESNATGTALVVNNGSAVVNGNVTVFRYIDPSLNPNRGYRHVSAPTSNATVSSLNTNFFVPVVNPAYNTSATPLLVSNFPTVYGYDQARLATTSNNLNAFDKGWYSPAATTDALNVGQGYTVLLEGDQTWSFIGPLNNGNQTVNLARNSGATAPDAGYALVGNPYPAPLDWSLTSSQTNAAQNGLQNVDPTMYVYRSNDPGNPYTGVYGFYNNGIGTTSPVVAQGQGFFVRVANGQTSGSVTFRNSQRRTDYTVNPTYQRTAETRPLVELHLQGTGSTLTDAAFVYFEQGATAGFDAPYDAEKLPNPSGLNLSTSLSTSLSATQRLAIDGRAPLGAAALTVPLAVGVPAAGPYTLAAAQLLNLGATPVYLRDRQTGALVDLRAQPSYSFTVSNAAALITGRFELVFAPQAPLATAPAALAAQVGLYPNPATATAFVELPATLGRAAVTAQLVDALGRPMRTLTLPAQGAAAHRLDLANLATGVYTLRLNTSAGVIVKKLVVQ